jgi:hypothetical protein
MGHQRELEPHRPRNCPPQRHSRIARFIEALEQAPREPDPLECEYVLRALAALDDLDFPRGEEAMMWAEWVPERRSPSAMAALPPVHQPISTAKLRQRLDRIMREAAAP